MKYVFRVAITKDEVVWPHIVMINTTVGYEAVDERLMLFWINFECVKLYKCTPQTADADWNLCYSLTKIGKNPYIWQGNSTSNR